MVSGHYEESPRALVPVLASYSGVRAILQAGNYQSGLNGTQSGCKMGTGRMAFFCGLTSLSGTRGPVGIEGFVGLSRCNPNEDMLGNQGNCSLHNLEPVTLAKGYVEA